MNLAPLAAWQLCSEAPWAPWVIPTPLITLFLPRGIADYIRPASFAGVAAHLVINLCAQMIEKILRQLPALDPVALASCRKALVTLVRPEGALAPVRGLTRPIETASLRAELVDSNQRSYHRELTARRMLSRTQETYRHCPERGARS